MNGVVSWWCGDQESDVSGNGRFYLVTHFENMTRPTECVVSIDCFDVVAMCYGHESNLFQF